jgi:cytochrome d ubiquinol oxidase subunit II
MLGHYITGLAPGWEYDVFAAAIAAALPAAYLLLGACWLIMKTEGELQRRAVWWAKGAWSPVVVGMGLISIATPWVSATVRLRWFSMPEFIALLPIPLMTLIALLATRALLNSQRVLGKLCWLPFMLVVSVFVLGFFGLAYSLYPYVVMDKLTIWQAASAPKSLKFILVGVVIAVPAIAGYTVIAYRVFRGKASELRYA